MSDLHIVIGTKTYSSWSLRGWLAVAHTGLDFRETKLALDTDDFHEKIGALSPTRCVPALHDGEITVWDSLAIIDYCARLAPEKNWWPESNAEFAYARSIAAEMHSGFPNLRSHAPMNFRNRWKDLSLSNALQKDISRIDQIWQECRARYGKGGDFLFGEFGAADMMYSAVVSRFQTYDFKVSDVSKDYMVAVLSHPLMREWINAASQEDQVVPMDEVPANATHLG